MTASPQNPAATYTDTRLFIDGQWSDAADGRTLDVLNPASGAVIGTVAHASTADLDRALDAADRGFRDWRDRTAAERASIMHAASGLVRERVDRIAELLTLEQGKPLREAKGEILYGLFEGRLDARRRGELLICEGNFDVLALHQAGLRNSVAPMGTAFTEAHAKLVRRFADRAVLLFDGDSAGLKAVSAVHPILAKVGVSARVVSMPCMELFAEQPSHYIEAVLPAGVPRVVVEAGIAMPWHQFTGGSIGHSKQSRKGAGAFIAMMSALMLIVLVPVLLILFNL